jgi:pilus assembly protein CpaB
MRVDVLVTGKPPEREDTQTRTVLQNITVLSAGQTIQTDGKNQPITTPVVTLLVNPAEAEALTLALSEGKIQLALRNSTDRDTIATGGRRLNDLYDSSAAPVLSPAASRPKSSRAARASAEPVEAKPAPPATPVVQELEVIRGTVKKVEVFPRESNSQ